MRIIDKTTPMISRFFLDTSFGLAENVVMSRKNSLVWMGLYCAIWGVYLSVRFFAPPSDAALLDLILVLSATLLLVPLVLLINRRIGREGETAFHLAARDEFMRMQASLGDRPPTRFFR